MTNLFKNLPKQNHKKAQYSWKDDNAKLLRMLRNSRTLKIKHGWSRAAGAGFIKDDVGEVRLNPDNTFTIHFNFLHVQTFTTGDLNLGETEELIEYLEDMQTKGGHCIKCGLLTTNREHGQWCHKNCISAPFLEDEAC